MPPPTVNPLASPFLTGGAAAALPSAGAVSWQDVGRGLGGAANWLGLGDPDVKSTAMDFTQAQQTRDTQNALLAQLLAASRGEGPSVAQGLLRQSTDEQMANAMALGAAQQGQGLGYGAALRQIADQRARIGQQSAGQAALLRAQEQQTAMGQLGQFSLGMRGQDIGQTGMIGEQAFRDEALRQQALQGAQGARRNVVGSVLNPAGAVLSSLIPGAARGGMVQGYNYGGKVKRPKGYAEGGMEHMDDEDNDTVPAMLSPGEIVLPRSVTMAKNAPEKAAAFVRAVMERRESPSRTEHPVAKMARGGKVMSSRQEHFMQAVAHGWKPSGRKGPSRAVAEEFLRAKGKAA